MGTPFYNSSLFNKSDRSQSNTYEGNSATLLEAYPLWLWDAHQLQDECYSYEKNTRDCWEYGLPQRTDFCSACHSLPQILQMCHATCAHGCSRKKHQTAF